MRVTWAEIVDYARGIASDEVRQAVEADPTALSRASLLNRLGDSAQAPVPESYLNRAKALLPILPERRVFLGRLVFSSSPIGLRSGVASARNLRFEFDAAEVEVRIEPILNTTDLSIVGILQTATPSQFRVTDGHRNRTLIDDDGHFDLIVGSDVRTLLFEHTLSGDVYEVELQ